MVKVHTTNAPCYKQEASPFSHLRVKNKKIIVC